MTQITLNIPDNKISFFMQLVKKFNYIKVELPVLEDHKQLVRKIKNKTKVENCMDEDTFFKTLDEKLLGKNGS